MCNIRLSEDHKPNRSDTHPPTHPPTYTHTHDVQFLAALAAGSPGRMWCGYRTLGYRVLAVRTLCISDIGVTALGELKEKKV